MAALVDDPAPWRGHDVAVPQDPDFDGRVRWTGLVCSDERSEGREQRDLLTKVIYDCNAFFSAAISHIDGSARLLAADF